MSLVEIKNVNKTYSLGDIEVRALQNISLNINSGEFVSIMGQSGSGKSTLMNILGCLDVPTSGDYILDEINVKNLERDELAQIRNEKIGFVFQGFNLISRTSTVENIEMPMVYKGIPQEERLERVYKALKIVGLEDRAHHMPNQLSGGQQQRVAIARSLVNDAPIILADEPTGNLDSKTSYEIMDLFTRLNSESKKTIILVTHEQDIAEFSKRIIRFKDGNLVKDEVLR